jgi:hypothetical protein
MRNLSPQRTRRTRRNIRGAEHPSAAKEAVEKNPFHRRESFAKLRTGSEDAEEYILDNPGGRDYRNGLGYMGEGNRARRSGEPRYPRQLPTRQLPDGRPLGS